MPGKQTTLTIRTPEGVTFDLLLASPVSRCLAWAVDFAIQSLVMIASLWGLSAATIVAPGLAIFLMSIILLAVPVAYGMLFETLWRGQTIGKRLSGLRVIDETGLALTGGQIVVRNLLRVVDALPLAYLVGGVFCAFTRRCQRLGDLAAGTVVVRSVREGIPEVDGILRDKYNSFRDHPHLEARLRQRTTPEEAQIVLSALLRRDRLAAEERLELYADLADYFRNLVPFPEVVVHGLTDEQYLRNVADSLFRRRTGSGTRTTGGEGGA